MDTTELRAQMGKVIVNFEARRDRDGKLVVYNLPADDGGGAYEVAGINQTYDRVECDKLVALVKAGQQAQAEVEAADYIRRYTDAVLHWALPLDPGTEFYLRDSVFNRGPGGAAKILQIALGVTVDGGIGDKSKTAFAAFTGDLLTKLRAAREYYERHYVHRDESSHFWKGLVNRWDNALTVARKFKADSAA